LNFLGILFEIKLIFINVRALHIKMLELDLTDIRNCERHLKCTHSSQKSSSEYCEYNNQLYSNFIDDEIFVCDIAFRPLDLDGLRKAFKYWITCTCPGYNKYQFSELVELITKKFGKKN